MYQFEKLDTTQKVFNYIAEKLYNQDGPSISLYGGCSLRGTNSRKCAVGHIIPDNLYKKHLEEDSSFNDYFIDQFESERFKTFLRKNKLLLESLQGIHDDLSNISDPVLWKETILHNLNYYATSEHVNLIPYTPKEK